MKETLAVAEIERTFNGRCNVRLVGTKSSQTEVRLFDEDCRDWSMLAEYETCIAARTTEEET